MLRSVLQSPHSQKLTQRLHRYSVYRSQIFLRTKGIAGLSPNIRHCSYRRNEMCKAYSEREVVGGGMDVSSGREILPGNVIPRHYDLTLEPDLKKLTYEGHVVVDLDVVEDTTKICLNTLELNIHSTKVTSGLHTIRSVTVNVGDDTTNHQTPVLPRK
jgi:aminopeptidase 2